MNASPGPRVVHLLPATADAGAENQARYLLAGLAAEDGLRAELELVYFRAGTAHHEFEATGVRLHQIPSRSPLTLDWPRRVRRLRSLYAERPPDILHLWLYEAIVVGALAARTWPACRVILAQRSGTMMQADRMRTTVLRGIRGGIDHVLANSREGLELLANLGYDRARMSLTPNAVAPERVTLHESRAATRARLGIPDGQPLLCTVGRADATKDLPGLMRAFQLMRRIRPEVRLLLVGPTLGDLERLGAHAPEGVIALGWRPQPAELMAAADLVVIPSWTEGHSNTADEALMLGLPVLTTDTGEHPALVAAAGGRVVPIRDPESLARAALELLDAPPEPDTVRAVARQELSVEAATASVAELYRLLLAR